jgi:hypothetical protein
MVFPPIFPLVLLHEPYLREAVPPRCFNHLCLFHFSAPFSQLSDQTGEAFISPLIHLYARQCNPAFPRMLLIVYPFRA